MEPTDWFTSWTHQMGNDTGTTYKDNVLCRAANAHQTLLLLSNVFFPSRFQEKLLSRGRSGQHTSSLLFKGMITTAERNLSLHLMASWRQIFKNSCERAWCLESRPTKACIVYLGTILEERLIDTLFGAEEGALQRTAAAIPWTQFVDIAPLRTMFRWHQITPNQPSGSLPYTSSDLIWFMYIQML